MGALPKVALAALLFIAIAAPKPAPFRPVPPTGVAADTLIRTGERHFAHLWQLTFGGQNAEAYWSGDGRKFIYQWTSGAWPCDQQYVYDLATGARTRVSPGTGRTTCGYFYDHDRRVLFASTHAGGDSCPPPPDMSHGYTWAIYPTYDIWTAKPDGSDLQRLVGHDGYDAEGTMSSDGKWLVSCVSVLSNCTWRANQVCPAGFEVGSWIALMEHAANPKPSLTKTLPKCYKNPLCASA